MFGCAHGLKINQFPIAVMIHSDYILAHGPGDRRRFTSFNIAQALKQADLMGLLNWDDSFSSGEL